MTVYVPREIGSIIASSIESMPVVVLSGMRQTGKSTFLNNDSSCKGRKYLTLDDPAILSQLSTNPMEILNNEEPLIIDEAQKLPELLALIKRAVDSNPEPGRFILSGSSNFLLLKKVTESLAGRAVYYVLNPFTRREITASKKAPFLVHFMKSGKIQQAQNKPIIWKEIITGGMPSLCLKKVKNPAVWFRGFEQTYLERDIRALNQISDVMGFRNLLQLAAFRTGSLLNMSDLARDSKLTVMTVMRYLGLMEASFVIKRLQPYLKNKASRIIKSPKLYFSDTGLAGHLINPAGVHAGDPMLGHLVENYVLQNLEGVLSTHFPDSKITFWNIQGRHEVDFILEINGKTICIEVKYAEKWKQSDLDGLKAFMSEAGDDCMAGFLAYNGKELVKIEEKIWAVPLGILLG